MVTKAPVRGTEKYRGNFPPEQLFIKPARRAPQSRLQLVAQLLRQFTDGGVQIRVIQPLTMRTS